MSFILEWFSRRANQQLDHLHDYDDSDDEEEEEEEEEEEKEEEIPSTLTLPIDIGEMNSVLVILGWLNDRDIYRVLADEPFPGDDENSIFEDLLGHMKKYKNEPLVKSKNKWGISSKMEKNMLIAIEKTRGFHKRWPANERKKILRIISLMILHRRGNRTPGLKFPKLSAELFDMYHDMFNELLKMDRSFQEFKNQMFDPPPVPGYIIQRLPQRKADGDRGEIDVCPICTMEPEKDTHITELPCGHKFHGPCIALWLWKFNNCPLCRAEVTRLKDTYDP